MKRITILITCICTAACILLLVVLTGHFPYLFSSMITFPFEQIGYVLGALSKAGFAGNGIATAVWIGISAVPAIIALRYGKSKETWLERISLYLLSAIVLLAIYGMVNPTLFYPAYAEGSDDYFQFIKGFFGISVWSVVVLYIILRLIRLFLQKNKEQLIKYMRGILYVLCIIFTGAATISITNGAVLLMTATETGADGGFGILQIIVELTPYIFDIIIITHVMDLLVTAKDGKQDGIAESAGRVSRTCCLALGVTTALTAVSNILQIVLMQWLSNISVNLDIPITSIAFTVMILLTSRLLIENKALRDDNSLII